jgi:hypothetical protein
VNRRDFLAASGGGLAVGACALAPSAVSAAAAVPELAPGNSVADLRFGFAPTPPPFPGYTPLEDAKALLAVGSVSPATSPIPGTLATGSYAENQRYVIRVPKLWNGKLIVAGTPAFRSEFANDAIWSDFALANGYAFASSNKGIKYNAIVEAIASSDARHLFPIPFDVLGLERKGLGYRLGALEQHTSIGAWNDDFALLTRATQNFLQTYFWRVPTRTYAVGLSNGGAQVRSLVERHGDLVDGGVDWSGVFWAPHANVLVYLPKFLAAMPGYVAAEFNDPSAATAVIAGGYPADRTQNSAKNPSLWFEYYANQASLYADLTTFAYALLIDPRAASAVSPAGCTPNSEDPVRHPGTCAGSGLALPASRAGYVLSPAAAANIVAFEHTGAIRKPLVSIAGGADMFITPANNAQPYLDRVNAAGKGAIYWQYLVTGGTHVDTFAALGYGLVPQLPFAWAAFDQLVAIVERGYAPSGAGTQQTVVSPSEIKAS